MGVEEGKRSQLAFSKGDKEGGGRTGEKTHSKSRPFRMISLALPLLSSLLNNPTACATSSHPHCHCHSDSQTQTASPSFLLGPLPATTISASKVSFLFSSHLQHSADGSSTALVGTVLEAQSRGRKAAEEVVVALQGVG